MHYASPDPPPAGWHLCDGSLQPTASFPRLYNLVNYTFGGMRKGREGKGGRGQEGSRGGDEGRRKEEGKKKRHNGAPQPASSFPLV